MYDKRRNTQKDGIRNERNEETYDIATDKIIPEEEDEQAEMSKKVVEEMVSTKKNDFIKKKNPSNSDACRTSINKTRKSKKPLYQDKVRNSELSEPI